jgi:SAM-dependent methyltransferase
MSYQATEAPKKGGLETLKTLLPRPARRLLSEARSRVRRKLLWGKVNDFSKLRRLQPYRSGFGMAWGQCIDRHYIEGFLNDRKGDIQGCVLEVDNPLYTLEYGGSRVSRCDVIDLDEKNPRATIIADLTYCDGIADNTYDCVVLPQTLLLIYDFDSVIRNIHRILKPGGVVLATVPGIAQLCPTDMIGGASAEYWRFTRHSVQRMFSKYFGEADTQVKSYGNVLTAVAFLHGLVVAELTREELDYVDPDYEVTIAVRARKRAANPSIENGSVEQ